MATWVVFVIYTSLSIRVASVFSNIVTSCPLTSGAWMERDNAAKCDRGRAEFYHCFRNDRGELWEECRPFTQADPSRGCPYFSGDGDLGYTECLEDTGCPNASDSKYLTNELYKYPACLRPLKVSTTSYSPSASSTGLSEPNNNLKDSSHDDTALQEEKSVPVILRCDIFIVILLFIILVTILF